MAERVGPRLSVVVPVFNERATIEEILLRIQAVKIDKEILVVDDGSTDGTRELLRELDAAVRSQRPFLLPTSGVMLDTTEIRLLFHERNLGKGAAVRLGFAHAKGAIVLIQDADLEYDPDEYPHLMEPIERGIADVVYGSRFMGGPRRVLLFWHYVGNKALTLLSNMFTNLNLSDVWTCYKVFRREVVAGLILREAGFEMEPEITARIARAKWRVYEVPISYNGRGYAEGKKITWRNGVWGIWAIVRYNVLP